MKQRENSPPVSHRIAPHRTSVSKLLSLVEARHQGTSAMHSGYSTTKYCIQHTAWPTLEGGGTA